MTLCPSASRLPLLPHIYSLIPSLPLRFSSLSLLLSVGLSFRSSLPPGCWDSLHINRTLVTAFSASSCLLSPSRCSISSIMYLHTALLFHPSLSPFFFLTTFLFSALSFLSSAPSVLTIHSICHPSPAVFPHPFSVMSLPSPPVLWIVWAAPPYLAVSLSLSSLSISPRAIDGGAGCWPRSRREAGSLFARSPDFPLSFPYLSPCLKTCCSYPRFFLSMSSPFRQRSLGCHSAVCPYFPCCQPFAWPEWQPWQLKTLRGPSIFSLENHQRRIEGIKGDKWRGRIEEANKVIKDFASILPPCALLTQHFKATKRSHLCLWCFRFTALNCTVLFAFVLPCGKCPAVMLAPILKGGTIYFGQFEILGSQF